jgi:hypothetical protein
MKKYLAVILLLVASTIGFLVFDDYGLSSDEEQSRRNGKISLEYVGGVFGIWPDTQRFFEWKDKDYGVAFELPLSVIERVTNKLMAGKLDVRGVFLIRHLLTHIFFLLAAFFGFLLIDFLYKNKWLASIAFLMFVLHPRIYAHSFFNSKDIPFMSMLMICLYLAALAFHHKQIKHYVIAGIGIGLLINIRIMGVILLGLVPFFLLLDAMMEKDYKKNGELGLIFLFTAAVTTYVTWPYLWINPLWNFIQAFINMSKFRWPGVVVYCGNIVKGSELGWDYIPIWFSVTTPILFLYVGFSSAILLLVQFIKNPKFYLSNRKQRNNIFYIILFLLPVLAVITLHSVLYDGWRQMFFIYPPFVLLSIYVINFLFERKFEKILLPIIAIALIPVVVFMVKNHPFQQVYFNAFVDHKSSEYLRDNFDFEYWGASYKQSLEYILENDHSTSISVAVGNNPGRLNRLIIPAKDRARLKFVSMDEATYYITNFRYRKKGIAKTEHPMWHAIKVGNNTVNGIYKLK